MPQSLAKIYIHLIFSTKNRERVLPDEIRTDLHAYMGGTLNGLGCSPIEINTEPDHAHLLFVLMRTETLSNVVGQVKKSANDWLRARDPAFASFWLRGIFSESISRGGGPRIHPQPAGTPPEGFVSGRVPRLFETIRN